MFADTWRLAETMANHYNSTSKPNPPNLNLDATSPYSSPNSPLVPTQLPLASHLLNQIYAHASMANQPQTQLPTPHNTDESYSPSAFSLDYHQQQQQQKQQQQQQQFAELFHKFLKYLPQKPESPTKSLTDPCSTHRLTQNVIHPDPSHTIQDLSLTKCPDTKDLSLEFNNLSSSTWGTIPSPPDKSSPTLNQSETALDFKSPSSVVKDTSSLNLIGPDLQPQRRQPFTHLNYPNLNSSISPRKLRDLDIPDQWKCYLTQPNPTPTNEFQGQDWNSQFKAMCDRLHQTRDPIERPMTSASQPSMPVDPNPALWSAHYYNQFLRCQQYYESYLQWFRLLGLNSLSHSDLENGQPVQRPTNPIPSLGQSPPAHQLSSLGPFPHFSPLAPNPFYSRSGLPSLAADLSPGRRGPFVVKTKRHSPLKPTRLKSQLARGSTNAPVHRIPSLTPPTDENPNFACKLCPKIYSQASALKMHVRTHTLPCRCSYCGKSFSRKWLLKGHERTHTGERPYACPICNRSFADRSNLRAHMQTHQRDKRYSCPRCPRSFSRMGLLNKHMTQCNVSGTFGHAVSTLSSTSGLATVGTNRNLASRIKNRVQLC